MYIDFLSFAPLCAILFPVGLLMFFGLRLWGDFDSLLEIFYLKHKDEWEKLGCPIGMFWKPPEVDFSKTLYWNKSTTARGELLWAWFFQTPKWIEGDIEASKIMEQVRGSLVICVICSVIGVVVALVFALIYN